MSQNKNRADDSDTSADNIASPLLVQARDVKFTASPYMRTRILAELREKRAKSQQVAWYRRLALVIGAVAVAVVAWTLRVATEVYVAPAKQAVAIKVDVQVANGVEIAMAEIELPEGVHFNSQAHPEINAQKKLTMEWNADGVKLSKFPFAVKSDELGVKTIKIRFFDKNKQLSQEQIVNVKFI